MPGLGEPPVRPAGFLEDGEITLAKLVLSLNGSVLDQRFFDQPCLTIGRGADNDVVIDDPLLSRVHARIVSIGEDRIIEDLQSSNGTLVNGRPLVRQILQHQDVIELGAYHLRYLNTRAAADADLERTMLIQALPRDGELAPGASAVAVPAVRVAKARLPQGHVNVLGGAGQHAVGASVRLDRVVATFGIPGEQLIVIARRPQGYFLTHVEGVQHPRVNRQSIGTAPYALRDGDLIEGAAYQLEFRLDAPTGERAGEAAGGSAR
jgi:pSer/pThr/pTyr-binding forkhead associated (FHA) protein